MKTILVNGYFGINLGDDLFFKILFDRFPMVNFRIYSNFYLPQNYKMYRKIFKKYDNVKVFKYKKIRNLLYTIDSYNDFEFRNYDAAIYIGGSIFIEENNIGRNYKEKKQIIESFARKGKGIFILGSNFGPYKDEEFKNKFENIFKKCTDVCFRDNYSYEIFKNISNIRKAPDIVFSLKNKNLKKIENSIGISVISLSERKELKEKQDDYINKIKSIVESGLKRNIKFTLFSFSEIQGDLQVINEIINLINPNDRKKIEVVSYNGDIDYFLKKFSQMESIIGSRFHSCILSQIFKQGLYPLIYSDKTYNVLNDIGLNKEYVYIRDINKLDVEHVLECIRENKIDVSELQKEADNQFYILEDYING